MTSTEAQIARLGETIPTLTRSQWAASLIDCPTCFGPNPCDDPADCPECGGDKWI
jgi:hypothetical protein